MQVKHSKKFKYLEPEPRVRITPKGTRIQRRSKRKRPSWRIYNRLKAYEDFAAQYGHKISRAQ